MEEQLQQLLASFPELTLNYGTKRICCQLSGHEMPCRVEVVQSYVKGKKFQKLKQDSYFDYESFRPFIVPSEKRKNQLFCCLTGKYINRIPSHVEKHIAGRKYINAKEDFEAGKKELVSEINPKVRLTTNEGDSEEEESEVMTKDDTDVMDSPSLESPPIITERKRKTAKDTSVDKMPLSKRKKLILQRKRRLNTKQTNSVTAVMLNGKSVQI